MRECAEHWQAMWQRQRMTKRERKNADRLLCTLSAPCAVVSAHQLWPRVSMCVYIER